MTAKDAEAFASAIVDTILEGLESDRIVKIKGFGTFKLTAVKDRESVNVNTGERVVISGHDKISFTPENTVRDLVNKPFAQFETVILSDSVNLEDTPDTFADEIDENDDVSNIEESTLDEVPTANDSVVEEPIVDDSNTEEPIVEEPIVKEQIVEEPIIMPTNIPNKADSTMEDITNKDIIYEDIKDFDIHAERRKVIMLYAAIICILLSITSFALGYLACQNNWLGLRGEEVIVADVAYNPVLYRSCPMASSEPSKNQAKNDTVTNIKSSTVETASEPKTTEVKKQEPSKTASVTNENVTKETTTKETSKNEAPVKNSVSKYDSDPRVRTGAYAIVGVDQTITAHEGQTLKSISRTYLGPDMECYVEAINGKTEIKSGDKVKIPKLVLKKHLNKKK